MTKEQPLSGSYPKSIPYIIGNEFAERFNYYGIRAILTTFIATTFYANFPTETANARANEMAHYFVFFSYFMPIFGGLLADWFFGKYKVILYLSIVYSLGTMFLAFFNQDQTLFGIGLLLMALGAGGIKSSVSANVGDQFTEDNKHLISKVYGWFYFSINAGSVISIALVPVLKQKFGPMVAFGIPGCLMVVATIVFWSGRKSYRHVPPVGLKNALSDMQMWKENAGALGRVLSVFAFIPVYWAMWDQSLSEWVLQATKLDLRVYGDFAVLPEQVQTVNAFFLLTMIPVFTYFIYPAFDKIGFKLSPLRRIGLGMLLTALSFVVIAQIEGRIQTGETPSIWWQILAYAILSAGEVLVSITGLEYAYTNSPKAMKGLMTGFWLLTVAFGNIFVSLMNNSIANNGFFHQFTGPDYYWFFVKMMLINSAAFIVVAYFVKERNYVEESEA